MTVVCGAIAEIREIVRPEDFYRPQHASIF